MERVAVFDVGRVLIEWDVYALYRHLLPDDAAIDAFIAEVDLFAWNAQFDRGIAFADGIASHSAKFPHRRALFEAFDERWIETIPGAITGTVKVMEHLRSKGVPIFGITNFSAEKWPIVCGKYEFLANGFDGVVVSGAEGVMKPEAKIYEILLSRFGLNAGDCLFIDDVPANVEGARAVGMDGVQFTTPIQLISDLSERGFPVDDLVI